MTSRRYRQPTCKVLPANVALEVDEELDDVRIVALDRLHQWRRPADRLRLLLRTVFDEVLDDVQVTGVRGVM